MQKTERIRKDKKRRKTSEQPIEVLQFDLSPNIKFISEMASNRIRVLLYSGGTIINGAQGCRYSLPPKRMMLVNKNISLRVLLSEIHSKINIDPTMYAIRLICRYPWIHKESGTTYFQVPIDDDESLTNALDIPSSFPHFVGVEFSVIGLGPSSANLVGNNDIQESEDDNTHLFDQGVIDEGKKVVSGENDEMKESDSVLGNDDTETRMGDPDDDVPFYSDLGDARYHHCDSFDNLKGHVNVPVWFDEKSKLKKGMIFASKELFQNAVKRVCAREKKEYKVCISNPNAWKVQCKNLASQACSWMVSGKEKRHMCFEISKVNAKHSCTTTVSSDDHPNIDSKSIARMIRSDVAENPAYKPRDVRIDMHNIGIGGTYKKAWLGKKRAREDLDRN